MNYAKTSPKKYLFYTMIHPVTGFEEMKFNKKGSILYANVLCILFTLANIIKAVAEAFIFRTTKAEDVNILLITASCVGGLIVFTTANWMFCTLLDGKGRWTEIWTAVCYSLLPYTVISVPMTLIGHVFTLDEAVFYAAISTVVTGWTVVVAFIGIMVMQEFSISKNIITILLSFVGILIILFLALLIFTLFRNVYSFIVTIVSEVMFRI